MIEIRQGLILPKGEKLSWSKDLVIELHDKHLTVKCHYIYDRFINEDEAQGTEVWQKEYESHILKSAIYSAEWAWDGVDECYMFQIVCSNSSMAYNTSSKAQAIEQCNKILNWLLS